MKLEENYSKLKSYYENLSAPTKASMWFLICSIVQKCFSMISTPIFTRILSTTQYGQVANYYSWYDLLYPFVTMYISGVAYNNVLIKYDKDRDKATFSLMTLASFITFIFFSIYLIGHSIWNRFFGISTLMMCVMFIELLSVPILDFWSAKERYDYKYKKLIAVTLGSTVANFIFGITSVFGTTYKYEARIVSKVFIGVIIGVVLYIIAFKRANRKISLEYWKYALKISIPLIPHYLSIKILNQVDRVMITNMVSVSATGIYSLAYTVATLMSIVTDSINRSMCPFVYKGIKEGDIVSIRKMTNSVVAIVLSITILEMLVAPELISIFATSEYMQAIWIIPPVVLSVFFTFLYVIFSNVEFYYEKTIYATFTSIIVAIINILLNYVFIGKFNYYAAGYTTLICYILFAISHYIIFNSVKRKHDKLKNIFDIKFLFYASICGIIAMFGVLFLYQYFLIRIIVIAVIFGIIFLKRNKIIKILHMKL